MITEIRKVRKAGASLAVTIPSQMCKRLLLHEGANILFRVENNELVLSRLREKISVEDRIAMYKKEGLEASETLHDPIIR